MKTLSDGKKIKCQIWDTGTFFNIYSWTITIQSNYHGVLKYFMIDIIEER
jgi:hypothetical protein